MRTGLYVAACLVLALLCFRDALRAKTSGYRKLFFLFAAFFALMGRAALG